MRGVDCHHVPNYKPKQQAGNNKAPRTHGSDLQHQYGIVQHHDFGNNLTKQEMMDALNHKVNRIESAFYTGARNSGKILVQFISDHLPFTIRPAHYINAGDELGVNLSLMRPIRCNKCQRHGHKTTKCRSTRPICAYCSYPDHTYDQCKDRQKKYRNGNSNTPPNCAACYEARLPCVGHQVTSKTCPVYIKYEQSVTEKK